MDCGAYFNTGKYPYVMRLRGCEFSLTGADLTELINHLLAVRDGASESFSEEYKDLRTQRRNEVKGVDLIAKLGIQKAKKVLIERRL